MKINWNKFHVYADIAKRQEIPVENPQEQVANVILQQEKGIAAYHLADKVYKDNGETVYEGREAEVINRLTGTLPAFWAVALKESIVE
jgi:hypothetical protein